MNAAKFLDDIKAKFATPEEYAAAVDAVGEIMRERAEALKWADFYERAQSAAMTIIGDEFSLDPPDGGDVKLAEATQRLRTAYETASRERDAARALLREAGEVVQWYGENARLCRLIHSGGDTGRQSLSNDGGKRALAFLARIKENVGE